MKVGAVTFDAKDPEELAEFYQKLLGWKKMHNNTEDGNFIIVYSEDEKGPMLLFQEDPDYEPPVWPSEKGRQMTMVHIDIHVTRDEYEKTIRHAISCGAVPAKTQFSDKWKVMIDPAGHPFCIEPLMRNK